MNIISDGEISDLQAEYMRIERLIMRLREVERNIEWATKKYYEMHGTKSCPFDSRCALCRIFDALTGYK